MGGKRRNREKTPARKGAYKEPGKTMLVLCHPVTEKQYLKGYIASVRNPKMNATPEGCDDAPKQMVERAIRAKEFEYDTIWCVMDVDEHPHLFDAIQLAQKNDIKIAISNPCFELWLLLHFRDNPGWQHRHQMQKLHAKEAKISASEKHLDFDKYKNSYKEATDRATRMYEQAVKDNDLARNPLTNVYELTEEIRGGKIVEELGFPKKKNSNKSTEK